MYMNFEVPRSSSQHSTLAAIAAQTVNCMHSIIASRYICPLVMPLHCKAANSCLRFRMPVDTMLIIFTIAISAIIIKKFSFDQFGDYFRVAMVTWLGLVAFLTIVFLITSLFKSAAGGMVIGIIIASGLLQTIEKLLDLLIANLSGADLKDMVLNAVGASEKTYFKISEYCLDNVYLSYSADMGAGDTVRTILVFLCYIALGLGLVILFVRKRDVR